MSTFKTFSSHFSSFKKLAAFVLIATGIAFSSQAVNVLVSGTSQANDQALVDFLKNNFQNVNLTYGDYSDYSAHAAEIQGADVFMVARYLYSPAYANSANSAAFNSLTNPVVCFTSYVARPDGGRWGWQSGAVGGGYSVGGAETTLTPAGAGVFGGTPGTVDWFSAPSGNNFWATATGSMGDGLILATLGGDPLAVGWRAGDHSGTGVTFGGNRLLFNLPQDGQITVIPTAAGQQALINALTNYTPLVQRKMAAKVFIIGDSTVLNYSPIVGWGQEIYHYFDHNVFVQDSAYPGESSKTFITDGRWANVLSQLSTNDYLLIQFGHNDSHNPIYPEATNPDQDSDSAGTNVDYYRNNLKRYIIDARAKGAIPVFVTPMHRRSFDTNGNLLSYIVDSTGYTNDLAPYAAAMKQVAASNNVPCVDLFASSGVYFQQLGNDVIYSNLMYLGDGGTTHFDELGATVMASMVAQGLSEVLPAPASPTNTWELSQYLRRDVLAKHHADIENDVFPRPVFTLEPDGDNIRLDWFLQPDGIILEQSTNLMTWTQWDTGAAGTAGAVNVLPETNQNNQAFFRLLPP